MGNIIYNWWFLIATFDYQRVQLIVSHQSNLFLVNLVMFFLVGENTNCF
jgi:hypothetical protein